MGDVSLDEITSKLPNNLQNTEFLKHLSRMDVYEWAGIVIHNSTKHLFSHQLLTPQILKLLTLYHKKMNKKNEEEYEKLRILLSEKMQYSQALQIFDFVYNEDERHQLLDLNKKKDTNDTKNKASVRKTSQVKPKQEVKETKQHIEETKSRLTSKKRNNNNTDNNFSEITKKNIVQQNLLQDLSNENQSLMFYLELLENDFPRFLQVYSNFSFTHIIRLSDQFFRSNRDFDKIYLISITFIILLLNSLPDNQLFNYQNILLNLYSIRKFKLDSKNKIDFAMNLEITIIKNVVLACAKKYFNMVFSIKNSSKANLFDYLEEIELRCAYENWKSMEIVPENFPLDKLPPSPQSHLDIDILKCLEKGIPFKKNMAPRIRDFSNFLSYLHIIEGSSTRFPTSDWTQPEIAKVVGTLSSYGVDINDTVEFVARTGIYTKSLKEIISFSDLIKEGQKNFQNYKIDNETYNEILINNGIYLQVKKISRILRRRGNYNMPEDNINQRKLEKFLNILCLNGVSSFSNIISDKRYTGIFSNEPLFSSEEVFTKFMHDFLEINH